MAFINYVKQYAVEYASERPFDFGSFPVALLRRLISDASLEAQDLFLLFQLLHYYYATFGNDHVKQQIAERVKVLETRAVEAAEISSTAVTILQGLFH